MRRLTRRCEEGPISRAKNGRSIQMPSVRLELGQYVTLRQRADGTYRVLFEVPPRLRPSGWLPTFPLPIRQPRTGNLSDAAEVARIKADAAQLLQELREARSGPKPQWHARSFPALVEAWKAHDTWKALKPRSQRSYAEKIGHLMAWSASINHPPVEKITAKAIREFLALYKDRQAQRQALLITLRTALKIAIEEGWVERNVAADVVLTRTQAKRPVVPWTAKDVDDYCAASERIDWPSGANLVRLQWETAQDASDVTMWTRDMLVSVSGVWAIDMDRGKTGVPALIPVSGRLADQLRSVGDYFFVVDRDGRALNDARDDTRRDYLFRLLQADVVANGGRKLNMKQLRHSAATDAVDHGASFEETQAVTAHSSDRMLRQTYVQRSFERALAVQRKRGIV